MGNVLLDNKKKGDPILSLESWIQQNPDLMNKKILLENKVFRTMSFMYNSSVQSILMKAHFKWDLMNLEDYRKGFELYRKVLDPSYYHNLLPFIQYRNFESPKEQFVSVTRQYLPSTVEQRLTSQPSLSIQQKSYLLLQMIICVYGLHSEANLYHGHIRTSNFLLQTNDHVVLTDFASYKPLYMLEDDLGEFRLYYGSSGSKCCLAPEKLIPQSERERVNRSPIELLKGHRKDKTTRDVQAPSYISRISMKADSTFMSGSAYRSLQVNLTEVISSSEYTTQSELVSKISDYSGEIFKLKQMDIFSLGCTMLDVLLNGKFAMTHEDLLKLKRGEFSLQPLIMQATQNAPHTEELRQLLSGMLQKDPDKRPTIEELLYGWLDFTGKSVPLLLWYMQMAFCKGSFFLPDLRIGLFRRVIEKVQQQAPLTIRQSFTVDLPLSMQKIEFLRNFLSQTERNILPNLAKIFLLNGTILERIEQQLVKQAKEEPVLKKSESQTDEFDICVQLGDKAKQQTFKFSSSQNMYLKRFTIEKQNKKKEVKKHLHLIKWTSELEALQKARFRGSKLSEQELAHNIFQDTLQAIKKGQNNREQAQVRKVYYEYEQFLKVLFSCIRRAKLTNSRMAGVQLLYIIGSGSQDRIKMQKVLPYLFSLTSDPDIQVSCLALRKSINLFYSIIQPFPTLQDTKYYRFIIQNFSSMSKNPSLRSVFFELLPQVCSIIEWLMIHYLKHNRNAPVSDDLLDSVLKQYGVYNSSEKEILMGSIAEVWAPNVVPFFGSTLNIEKVLGFKEGVKIAQKALINSRYEFLDMCLESGLDESGIAAFFAIRYFKIRKITSQHIVSKIVPLTMYPHKWIRDQAIEYINMCLDMYPATKLYFLFNKLMNAPFPLEPESKGDMTLLPRMLTFKEVDMRDKKVNYQGPPHKTVELFKKYISKAKPHRQFPQLDEEQLRKWKNASKDLLSESDEKRPSDLFGDEIIEALTDMHNNNLLVYLNFLKRPQIPNPEDKAFPFELVQLCQRTYDFNLKGGTICSEQKLLFSHIQTYLNSNVQSFLRTNRLISSRSKFLFSENLLRVNWLCIKYDSFNITPSVSLGKFTRNPIQFSRKPLGTLVAQLHQHHDTISCIEKVGERFFLTGSNDGTLRFWDSKRLEEDVTTDSFAVIDFREGEGAVKVASVAAIEETQSFVVGTSKGNIGIYRLEDVGKDLRSTIGKAVTKVGITTVVAPVQKYNVKGEIEKILTFRNDSKRNCFSFITAEGYIGLQDIRVKNQCLRCPLGKQRGLPKCLLNINSNSALLIGTLNGYVLTYDIRCNLLSAVHQLYSESQALPILSLTNVPLDINEVDELVAICYPAKNYEFCYFNVNNPNSEQIRPTQQFTSGSQDEIVVTPLLVNRTKSESFMNCTSTLSERSYERFMPEFYDKIDILEHLRDPLTQKANVTKERWLANSKQRYSQISSISNKRYLPFLEYLQTGILTHFNPCVSGKGKPLRQSSNLTILNLPNTQSKRESKMISPIQKDVKRVSSYNFIPEQQAPDYFTCCKVLNGMVVTGGRDSVVRIYK